VRPACGLIPNPLLPASFPMQIEEIPDLEEEGREDIIRMVRGNMGRMGGTEAGRSLLGPCMAVSAQGMYCQRAAHAPRRRSRGRRAAATPACSR
jgi:hypothetical protein